MISIHTILILLGLHFLADFCLQTRWMATNKSKDIGALFSHMTVYGIVLWAGLGMPHHIYPHPDHKLILFVFFSMLFHALQDVTIWNLYKLTVWARRRWYPEGDFLYQNDPAFYATIGLDQILHFITLAAVYVWLDGWASGIIS